MKSILGHQQYKFNTNEKAVNQLIEDIQADISGKNNSPEMLQKIRNRHEELNREIEIFVIQLIKEVVHRGVYQSLHVFHRFCVLREKIMIANIEEYGTLDYVSVDQVIPKSVKLLDEELELVNRFNAVENFLYSFPAIVTKIGPHAASKVIDCEHWCVFLTYCLVYCEGENIYSKIRSDLYNLFLEKVTMMEETIQKPLSFYTILNTIQNEIEIQNEDDLLAVYNSNPDLIICLPDYIKKIQNIYNPTKIIVSIDYDYDYGKHELLMSAKTELTVDEVMEKDDIFIDWTLERENPQENHIIVFAEAKE